MDKKYELIENEKNDIIDIVYNSRVYGKWDKEANLMYPEDLTLDGDLIHLLEMGIQMGIQIEKDRKDEFQ
jgi:hypothetical protein